MAVGGGMVNPNESGCERFLVAKRPEIRRFLAAAA
jgi:hypothetical protein